VRHTLCYLSGRLLNSFLGDDAFLVSLTSGEMFFKVSRVYKVSRTGTTRLDGSTRPAPRSLLQVHLRRRGIRGHHLLHEGLAIRFHGIQFCLGLVEFPLQQFARQLQSPDLSMQLRVAAWPRPRCLGRRRPVEGDLNGGSR
jgi:hypothetical protein